LVASGNGDIHTGPDYPANLSVVIAVGASNNFDEKKNPGSRDGQFWWGGDYGNGLDITGPTICHTTDIVGTGGFASGDYTSNFNGTSAATPNTAGVAALVLATDPTLTSDEVQEILEKTADKIDLFPYDTTMANGDYNTRVGYGRVNAYAAVQLAQGNDYHPPSIVFTPIASSLSTIGGRSISSKITDMNGIAGGLNKPVLYYRIDTGSGFSAWMSVSDVDGPTANIYEFIIPQQSNSTHVAYYVTAKDASAQTNTGSFPFGAVDSSGVGDKPPPQIFQYWVGDTGTDTFSSSDVPKNISPSGTDIVTSNLLVDSSYSILDVNLTLDMNHTFDADLKIILTSPGGTSVCLASDLGGNGNNFSVTLFDDEAGQLIVNGSAPFNGTYQPEYPLYVFDGENPSGTWQLTVYDQFNGDGGQIRDWSLTFTKQTLDVPPVSPVGMYVIAQDGSIELKWNRNSETDLNKYYIYRDVTPVPTTLIDSVVAMSPPDTTYIDNTVVNGQIYYYRITAGDLGGNESDSSNIDAGVSVSGQGNALSLDGTGDYLTVSHDSTIGITGDITIEAWVFLNSISGTQTFVSKRDDATGRNTYQFGTQNSGKLFFFYQNSSDQSQLIQTNTAPLAPSGWHHCAVVINGTTVAFYLDGNSYNADASISNSRDDASNRVLYLGSADLNQDFVSGFMEDIRIWNVQRDSSQIAGNMTDPLRGDENDLVSLWHFNEPSGNQIANDAAPNSNNGSVNGDADFAFPDIALPIDLMIFTAKSDRGVVRLYWKTASEIENAYFILDRSILEDENYLEVDRINGQGNKASETEYRYLDRNVKVGESYYYRLSDVDFKGNRTVSDIILVSVKRPGLFRLSQNYPNPFNPKTSIRYDIPINAVVSLNIYDVLGRDVIQLVHAEQVAGFYTVQWDGKNKFGEDTGSGVYFYWIIATGENGNKFSQVKKMVMVK